MSDLRWRQWFLSVNSPAPELTARVRLRSKVEVKDKVRIEVRVRISNSVNAKKIIRVRVLTDKYERVEPALCFSLSTNVCFQDRDSIWRSMA